MELLLIRHGESEANVGRSTDADCPLTERGVEQARRVARQLGEFDLRGFAGIVSPYRRAAQTAAEIALIRGITFEVDEGVREWGPGAAIGGRHFPSETPRELVKRLEDFLRRHSGRKLIVVSHAAPIAALTHLAWGEVPNTEGQFWLGVNNCCPRWLKSTCILPVTP